MTDDMHDGRASLYALDALSPEETEDFERHLAGCAACRREVDETRRTTAALSASVATPPPPGLRSAVLSRITETPQEPAGAATVRPDAAVRPEEDAARPEEDAAQPVVLPPPRGRSTWRRVPYLVAAVAVLVALAGVGWGLQAHRAAQVAAEQSRLISQVVSAPDATTHSAGMSGGGTASVIVSKSRDEALFVGSRLPPLADGRVYQLWTIHDQHKTSAGLVPRDRASVVVVLPPAALTASAVAVTEEPSGGSRQPTGSVVLAFPLA